MRRAWVPGVVAVAVCGGLAAAMAADDGATEQYTIDRPAVNARLTRYPPHAFRKGDVVEIRAGGCVYVGGEGRSAWRRFVDPRGPDSDHRYHGLVLVPGAMERPMRLAAVAGRSLTVTEEPAPNAFLAIGYEDDDYSDNGYADPHGSNGGACDGGQKAYVTVTVHHANAAAPHAMPASTPAAPAAIASTAPATTASGAPAADKASFFATLPGLLTALATLVTAVGGLLVAFRKKPT